MFQLQFSVGDEVLALYPPDGKWHDAVVTEIGSNNQTVDVRYWDGVERTVKLFQVQVG